MNKQILIPAILFMILLVSIPLIAAISIPFFGNKSEEEGGDETDCFKLTLGFLPLTYFKNFDDCSKDHIWITVVIFFLFISALHSRGIGIFKEKVNNIFLAIILGYVYRFYLGAGKPEGLGWMTSMFKSLLPLSGMSKAEFWLWLGTWFSVIKLIGWDRVKKALEKHGPKALIAVALLSRANSLRIGRPKLTEEEKKLLEEVERVMKKTVPDLMVIYEEAIVNDWRGKNAGDRVDQLEKRILERLVEVRKMQQDLANKHLETWKRLTGLEK